jgi:phage terminase small subunit
LENEPTLTPLTNKQKVFVEEYLTDHNGTRSAIAAGYSRKSASVIAAENLLKPNIAFEIRRRITEKVMCADEVLTRLADMARASHFPFIKISDDGFVYFDFSNPDAKNYLHLIKKIKTKRQRKLEGLEVWENEWVEVELYDAQSALNTLAKVHGLLVDKTDVTTGGQPITIKVIYDDK